MRSPSPRFLSSSAVLFAAFSLASPYLPAQSGLALAPPSRIVAPVDERIRLPLTGNVHPLARPEFDAGPAAPSLPAERLMLLLRRSPQQEADLDMFLREVQNPASPHFHAFLSPDDFGRRFGPSDSDVQRVQMWLAAHGFSVAQVNKGRTAIQFSGTVGQVEEAFHTSIHRFNVSGGAHWANVADPQIPAALGPVVAGVSRLNDFKPEPQIRNLVKGRWNATAGRFVPDQPMATNNAAPDLTVDSNKYYLFVGPGDAATIYDTPNPFNSKFGSGQTAYDGAGVTIGVVGDAVADVTDQIFYRSRFGLLNSPLPVIIAEDSPSSSYGEYIEASLDTEVSAGVAPGASVIDYAAGDTIFQPGVLTAIYRAIDDNRVDLLSVSFGECEASLGVAGNLQILNAWQQASAQGITVTVAAGDSGSAGCDNPNLVTAATSGTGVNGLASTPYNIAVGGTDFDTLTANFFTYVSLTNGSNYTSVLSYIPEEPWNDSTATNGVLTSNSPAKDVNGNTNIWAGGGGPSTAAVNGSAGYAKPAWQQSFPPSNTDAVRDLPDVSLLAGAGGYQALWALCIGSDCASGAPSTIHGVGGTSAAAPAFAGILALVEQKAGSRLGQANWNIYHLAQSAPSAFHAITTGNNAVVCKAGSPGCGSNGFTTGYNAAAGYNMATGLGSIDAANLINHWADLSKTATATTLSLDKTTFQHGTAVNVTTTVAPSGAAGQVAIENDYSAQTQATHSMPATEVTLNAGTGSTAYSQFPGGSYNVWASYPGDGAHAGSVSQPVAVTVTPENSVLQFNAYSVDSNGKLVDLANTTVPFGTFISLNARPLGTSQAGNSSPASDATGSVQFNDAGSNYASTNPLDASGVAEWNPNYMVAGVHAFSASYSGDPSYNPSTASPVTVTISKAVPSMTVTASPSSTIGDQVSVVGNLLFGGPGTGPLPSGTVTFTDTTRGTVLGTTAIWGGCSQKFTSACAGAVLTVDSTQLLAGSNTIAVQYAGDANFNPAGPSTVTVTCNARCWNANGYNLALSMLDIQPGGIVSAGTPITLTVGVTPGGGFSGAVNLTCTVSGTHSGDQKIPTCSFNPTQVSIPANSTQAVSTTLTISSTAAQSVRSNRAGTFKPLAGAALASLLLCALPMRRARRLYLLAFAMLVCAAGLSSCGGGGSAGGGGTTGGGTIPGTTPDTYTVTFNAADAATGTITAQNYLKITVQ